MNGPLARGIGVDFGAGGCRVALQFGSSRLVCALPLPPDMESPKCHLGMQVAGNDQDAVKLFARSKSEAERQLGERICGGVIAVPPCFTDRQKAATRKCAEDAGFR